MDHGLSRRHAEVLSLLCEGLTNRRIATRLGIAEATVNTHVTASLQRLGASSRMHAAAILDGRRLPTGRTSPG
jgi:DNA-binding NarL/FixJ family response regulator